MCQQTMATNRGDWNAQRAARPDSKRPETCLRNLIHGKLNQLGIQSVGGRFGCVELQAAAVKLEMAGVWESWLCDWRRSARLCIRKGIN